MADSGPIAAEAGICICCVQAIGAFCFLRPYGVGSSTSAPCGGPRGCCGSCLDREPDEDSFERAQRKERERRMKKEAQYQKQTEKDLGSVNGTGGVSNQPEPTDAMHASPPTSTHVQ